eukprot:365129-Chlamydomonas_euryale.AAC.11
MDNRHVINTFSPTHHTLVPATPTNPATFGNREAGLSGCAQAISGDAAGTISVWHVPTGKLRFRFYEAHGAQRLTALAFDPTRRRLLTGADDGAVKVWNFNSGSCIMKLSPRTCVFLWFGGVQRRGSVVKCLSRWQPANVCFSLVWGRAAGGRRCEEFAALAAPGCTDPVRASLGVKCWESSWGFKIQSASFRTQGTGSLLMLGGNAMHVARPRWRDGNVGVPWTFVAWTLAIPLRLPYRGHLQPDAHAARALQANTPLHQTVCDHPGERSRHRPRIPGQ